VCVSILVIVIRYANCIFSAPWYIFICGLCGSTIFSTLSHKGHNSGEKIYWVQNVCSDFLYDFNMKYFSCYDEFSEILLSKYIGLHVTYLLLYSNFTWNTKFLDRFSKNSRISNFIKIRPFGAELFHADRQTDRHEVNRRFSQFWEIAYWLQITSISYVRIPYISATGSKPGFSNTRPANSFYPALLLVLFRLQNVALLSVARFFLNSKWFSSQDLQLNSFAILVFNVQNMSAKRQ
jgi:hypothetical protein